jgi:hypothetical protein
LKIKRKVPSAWLSFDDYSEFRKECPEHPAPILKIDEKRGRVRVNIEDDGTRLAVVQFAIARAERVIKSR